MSAPCISVFGGDWKTGEMEVYHTRAKEILSRMSEPLAKIQASEAEILGNRWGVKWEPVLAWMQARKFYTVMDLRVFSSTHAESMEKALTDFWEFST
jgi:hypothetical protein